MSIFEQLVLITEDYLGPAARRFISRQISFHLDKQPEEVTIEDIPSLTEWTTVTLALLTKDKNIVAEYSQKMRAIPTNTITE
jgi:hypothetical protein